MIADEGVEHYRGQGVRVTGRDDTGVHPPGQPFRAKLEVAGDEKFTEVVG